MRGGEGGSRKSVVDEAGNRFRLRSSLTILPRERKGKEGQWGGRDQLSAGGSLMIYTRSAS